jgi:hypothetical protein
MECWLIHSTRLTIRAGKVVIKLPAKYLPDLGWFIDGENIPVNSFYISKRTFVAIYL